MKKIIVVLIVFVAYSCGTIKNTAYYNIDFQNDVDKIPGWQKGETKKEFSARYKKAVELLRHKHFHYDYDNNLEINIPICCNTCEYCYNEMQKILEEQKELERQEEERRIAYQKELERQDEEMRIAYQKELERQKKELERQIKERKEIDSLRIAFVKENNLILKYHNLLSYCDKVQEKCQKKQDYYLKLRFDEIDALERQYIGRLDGEIFLTKKAALNQHWEYKIESIWEEYEKSYNQIKKFEKESINKFKAILLEKNYSEKFNYNCNFVDFLTNEAIIDTETCEIIGGPISASYVTSTGYIH